MNPEPETVANGRSGWTVSPEPLSPAEMAERIKPYLDDGAPTEGAALSASREPKCDHICLKDDGHVERGEPHFYGYELPSPRADRTAEVLRIIVRRMLDGWVVGDNCDPDTPEGEEWAWERCSVAPPGSWVDEREPFEDGVDEELRSFDSFPEYGRGGDDG